jgi:hypothetical protein
MLQRLRLQSFLDLILTWRILGPNLHFLLAEGWRELLGDYTNCRRATKGCSRPGGRAAQAGTKSLLLAPYGHFRMSAACPLSRAKPTFRGISEYTP